MPGKSSRLRAAAKTVRRGFGVLLLRSESERTIAMLGDPMTESFALLNRSLDDLKLEVARLRAEVADLKQDLRGTSDRPAGD